MKPTCMLCGHVHASDDARVAGGRFTPGAVMFRAAHAGTPPRATRAEAEADECTWRAQRRRNTTTEPAPTPTVAEAAEPPAPIAADPAPFPAAAMETAAREKAWHDFLAQVRFSLMVEQIDDSSRDELEPVTAWLRRCHADLSRWAGAA